VTLPAILEGHVAPLLVVVTLATPACFSELDDFLYALIGTERDEMPFGALSALARWRRRPHQCGEL
jgi:hypothetical protein